MIIYTLVLIILCLLFYIFIKIKNRDKTLNRKLERISHYEEVESIEYSDLPVFNFTKEEISKNLNIQFKKLSSPYVDEIMNYVLVTPKDTPLRDLPVLILFHGIRDSYDDWLGRAHLLENYLELISENKIEPMIFILPNSGFEGQSWYSNFYKDKKRKYENYIMNDLYEEALKFSPSFKIGIAGFSMGGYAALKIGLKYIDKFKVIGSFSGAVSIIRMSLNRRVFRVLKYVYIPSFLFSDKDVDKINFLKIFSPWGWRILKQDPYSMIKLINPKKFKDKYFYISVGAEDKEPYLMLQQWADTVGRLKKFSTDFKGIIYKNEYHTWEFISKDIKNFLIYFDKKIK